MSLARSTNLLSVFALMLGGACASGANPNASSGPGASAASGGSESNAPSAASSGAGGSVAPATPASSASSAASSNGAQNANVAQSPNATSRLHAYLNHVMADSTSPEGVSKSANGNALILTDDPNACAHAAAYGVLGGSTTVQMFDPNFIAAARAIGVQVNVADPNNTLVYTWVANDLNASNPNAAPLCSTPGYQGIDSGIGSFTVKAGGSLIVTLPSALSGRPVDPFVSTCSSAMVAPFQSSASPGHQLRTPVSCIQP